MRILATTWLIAVCSFSGGTAATTIKSAAGIDYSHGFSYLNELKYPRDFKHFDWVNPDAPQGGEVRVPVLGTYDSFNYFTDTGQRVEGMSPVDPNRDLYYDSLLQVTADEKVSQYGSLAEGFYHAPDKSWYAFKIREDAYWHDGTPITIDDVLFTFDTLRTRGPAWIISILLDIDYVEQIGPWEIKVVLKKNAVNAVHPVSAGSLHIIPKHFWEERDISRNLTEPPLGSGPYRISDYRLGRYVVYERNEDYWGNDQPTLRGRFNFKRIKFDYFRDDQVQMEALRGNVVDMMEDGSPKNWNVEYDFPARREGLFITEMFDITAPVAPRWPLFWNLKRERFQDVRVREALWLLYDFEYINRVMHYGFYEPGRSMYHGAEDMEPTELPSEAELEMLEPWRDLIPPRVFTTVFQPPENDGYGIDRAHVERAIELFAEAGWVIRDGQMVNEKTGEVFHIAFILPSHTLTRPLLPYVFQLEKVGISTEVRVPELSNWAYRIRHRQFDGSLRYDRAWRTIGSALRNRWHSVNANTMLGTTNPAGLENPVVDDLIGQIVGAQTNRSYEAAVKSIDRVMMWNFYMVPLGYLSDYPLVYWDKFGQPEGPPIERVPWLDGWWYDEEKAALIDERVAAAVE